MLIGKLNLRLKKGFVQAASLRKCESWAWGHSCLSSRGSDSPIGCFLFGVRARVRRVLVGLIGWDPVLVRVFPFWINRKIFENH